MIAQRAQEFRCSVLASRPVPLALQDQLSLEERDLIAADETDILTMIKHMQRDETPAAREVLSRLGGGPVNAASAANGLRLAHSLDPMEPQSSGTRPILRAC